MREIKFADGTKLEVYGVRGNNVNFQNASRDCLTFEIDSTKHTLSEIDELFTGNRCSTIVITDEQEQSFTYKNYMIRKSLEKSYKNAGGSDTPIERIYVSMTQLSYLEQQLAATQSALDAVLMGELTEAKEV